MTLQKHKRTFLLFLIILQQSLLHAQVEVARLTATDMDKHQSVRLSDHLAWYFKKNETRSVNVPPDTGSWVKLSPSQLSRKHLDEYGGLDSWFRIYISTDSSLARLPLYIYFGNWGQAADLYINGRFTQSFGSTGSRGTQYKRNSVSNQDFFIPFQFSPHTIYQIDLHYVYEPFKPRLGFLLKDYNLRFRFQVTGPEYLPYRETDLNKTEYVKFFRAMICLVLALLFWLIYFQNREEKILKLIVFSSSVFAALTAGDVLSSGILDISFSGFIILSFVEGLLAALLIYSIVLIFSNVFTGKMPRYHYLIILLIIVLAYGFSLVRNPLFEGPIVLLFSGICLAYILRSWKKVKGAQWSIIIGFLGTLLGMISFFISVILGMEGIQMIIASLVLLSFPVSLLVYVSLRFKEIIREVRENAAKLVQITEEKKQQALNQQVILEQQVKKRTAELSQSLQNLKATQSQLIQSEKMASLGELTAGIAHEIQNPLNFVNNFSDISHELLEEMKGELATGNTQQAIDIANDVIDNLEKILHHGKRADGIVKGMMQHSRTSSGQKEPTDINVLAGEYLRLAFHGLRAKDKSFNAVIKTDFDNSIGKINVMPQEIGRVILNLINNAFYTVTEKKKQVTDAYEPTVTVTTKRNNGKVEIIVKDNGTGIPQKELDKIFQPFFTTKPTGQGTGLGLSLAYDIVTKGHGGELKVATQPGEGTEFTIQLPVKHS